MTDRSCPLHGSVHPHGDDAQRLRWLIRRIADDDRNAFRELVDHCSAAVTRDLHRRIADQQRVAGILAGTFVEVWWLAGCHVDPGTDVMVWIDRIVQRRVTDSRPPPLPPAGEPGSRALWVQGAETQLADLLRRPVTATRR